MSKLVPLPPVLLKKLLFPPKLDWPWVLVFVPGDWPEPSPVPSPVPSQVPSPVPAPSPVPSPVVSWLSPPPEPSL